MEDQALNATNDKITGLMFVAILLGVFLLVVAVLFGTFANINTSTNGATYATVSVVNETGFINSSGYTVSGASLHNFYSVSLTGIFNRTGGQIVGVGNASISLAGVVTNTTAVNWNNASLSYTYTYDNSNSTGLNNAFTDMKDNVFLMVGNFFDLAPTIGTILAVVILIAGIVLLVMYVKRMKGSGENNSMEAFQG
jgi:hypothetical protein